MRAKSGPSRPRCVCTRFLSFVKLHLLARGTQPLIPVVDFQSSEYCVFRASHEQCELWQLWQNHKSCRRSARDAVCASIRLLIHFATFFFSSRRRHKRFDCDWSSDVCSSDLSPPMNGTRSSWSTGHGIRRVITTLRLSIFTGCSTTVPLRGHIPAKA